MARILVIDDHAENQDLLRYLLSHFGHDVSAVSGGTEGLRCALADPPDLVVIDITMPSTDSFKAARLIRAEPTLAEVPLIAITAGAVALEAVQAAGFDDFYQMPIEPEAFVARIGRHLSGQPASGPLAEPATPGRPAMLPDAGLRSGAPVPARAGRA
jgi:CheY-like chemotaxis protein